jgi:phage terminase small subunit
MIRAIDNPTRTITASGAILTPKQALFVEYYLGKYPCEIGNGTQAVKLAGFKAGTDNVAGVIAFENLRKPKINEYIRELLDKQVLTSESVDTELAYCLRQNKELPTKIKAIQEYNKLTGRHAPTKSVNLLVNANELLNQLVNNQQAKPEEQATTVKTV